jgi:hypothetical protein
VKLLVEAPVGNWPLFPVMVFRLESETPCVVGDLSLAICIDAQTPFAEPVMTLSAVAQRVSFFHRGKFDESIITPATARYHRSKGSRALFFPGPRQSASHSRYCSYHNHRDNDISGLRIAYFFDIDKTPLIVDGGKVTVGSWTGFAAEPLFHAIWREPICLGKKLV